MHQEWMDHVVKVLSALQATNETQKPINDKVFEELKALKDRIALLESKERK